MAPWPRALVILQLVDLKNAGTIYGLLEVKHNSLVVWKAGKRLIVNIDQVRLYHQRKSDENEIGVGSSDSNGSRYKSSNFESNDSQYSRNNGSGERQEAKGKKTSLKKDQSEGHTSITEKKKVQRKETAEPSTSRYNSRPRRDEKVESRSSSEKRTPQRGPVRSRRRREQQYNPYSVEQGRSCGLSTRSRRA
ncbi:hypothetical protein TNCV_1130441 [Trichonephila clavipes]|nr:hypothetical protein TNCV_1130441 [Trichonephila clavipes]